MKTVSTMCRFCTNTCPVDAVVKDGRLISVKRKPVPGVTVRRFCPKNAAAPHIVYAPDRITSPLVRNNADRNQNFKKVSWNTVLSDMADRLLFYKNKYGPESVAWLKGTGEDWGPVWQYTQRFMHAFGSPNVIGNGSLCHTTRALPAFITYGTGTRPDTLNAECIIVWGKNDKTSSPPDYNLLMEGIRHGAKLIVIDPVKTDIADSSALWLQIKPGCDGILAMSMMQVIIAENLYDSHFVAEWTTGFDRLTEEVRNYSPEHVASSIWLTPEEIRQAARLYAGSKPACIADGNGLDMNADVTRNVRAVCMLRALCGNLDIKGGDVFPQKVPVRDMSLKDVLNPKVKPVTAGYPLFSSFNKGGGSPVSTVIPDAILDKKPYPIRALIIQASNPLVTAANSLRVAEALKQVEFLVVIDLFMTRTAGQADIFLPATTTFETTQLNMAGLNANSMLLQEKVIEPLGDSRPGWQIIFDLARALKLDEAFPFQTVEEAIDFQLEPSGITVRQMREHPDGLTLQKPEFEKYRQHGFNTPSGKVEFYSETLSDYGYEPIPSFELSRAGRITFDYAKEKYPLAGISGEKSGWFVHSRYRNIPWIVEKEPEPFIDLHPDDAELREIKDNDSVRIISPNGEIFMKVRLSDSVRCGTVRVPWGWGEHDLRFNINSLTDDAERDSVASTPSVRAFMCDVIKRD
ncbi:molybdopterin-dependent oxidoreductase [uncultured Desulfobacter sp.]|uniref:molybdopterin-containing oxidoreductase family protein n=1 Tax=uncultured Desulfobacter sp. TaxID=240139 RepID=UPI002AA7B60B|nr:molybdopterin-dependent oxidoreductase [uncultured Desulfobacter sp.]